MFVFFLLVFFSLLRRQGRGSAALVCHPHGYEACKPQGHCAAAVAGCRLPAAAAACPAQPGGRPPWDPPSAPEPAEKASTFQIWEFWDGRPLPKCPPKNIIFLSNAALPEGLFFALARARAHVRTHTHSRTHAHAASRARALLLSSPSPYSSSTPHPPVPGRRASINSLPLRLLLLPPWALCARSSAFLAARWWWWSAR